MKPIHYLFAVCLVAIVGILVVSMTNRSPAVISTAAASATPTAAVLGDLGAMRSIVTDTQTFVTKGDAAGAKARIAEFETAWDNAQPTLRPMNSQAWDAVDMAADDALTAVRTDKPQAQQVAALATLAGQLDHPGVAAMDGSAAIDTSGKPAPCENMLAQVRSAKSGATLASDVAAEVADLEGKGVERCNSDDDARADGFFADALKLMGAQK